MSKNVFNEFLCLSLINLKVKNIEIKADGSSCEDTVNFINVTGSAKIITIDRP